MDRDLNRRISTAANRTGAETDWSPSNTQSPTPIPARESSIKMPPAGWEPSSERGRRQKNRIIEAALEVFAERNYANVGMASIAATAAVSTGTLYRYFPSKELLFISVLDRALYEMYSAARTRAENAGIREALAVSTHQYLRAFHRNRMVIGSAGELMASSASVRDMWWSMREQLHHGMLIRLRQHQELASLAPLEPTVLIKALTSMVDGFGQRAFVEEEFGPLTDAEVREAADVLAGVWYRSIFGIGESSSEGAAPTR